MLIFIICSNYFEDIFERVATEASKLAAYNKKSTISSREIQTSWVWPLYFHVMTNINIMLVWGLSSLENSQSTLYRKAPRPLQNIRPLPNKSCFFFFLFYFIRIVFFFFFASSVMTEVWVTGCSRDSNVSWDGFVFCFFPSIFSLGRGLYGCDSGYAM